MPLKELTGALGYKRAAHLLHRASFGPTKEQIDSYAALTPAQGVAQLFNQVLPDPALPIDPKTNKEWVITGATDVNSGDSDLQEFFKGWFMGQMLGNEIAPGISLAYSTHEKYNLFTS